MEAAPDANDILKITPLGSGNEVGRSCLLLEFKDKKILLDCGLHPAYTGLSALPFFDFIDPSTIDLVLITHFHVDHAAGLPWFTEKTKFKGKVYMTHPTKAIYKWLLSDYVKISSLSPEDQLYNDIDLTNSFDKIQVIDYHQEVEVCGIKFTPYNAGHVLGAAMFLIEIAGVKILYTGDYSREEDRHLMAAEQPRGVIPQVLICESTYGVQSHEPRQDRETRFTRMVHTIVNRGGRCLLPVFALGRAQELLLILDEYWQAHPELHNIPIYYASSLAKKCMTVYQTYTNMMNAKIREQAKTSNPFQFKHISNLKSIAQFDDVGPCVMMASPGMLQSGLSRELLELWCLDKRNGVIVPGYVVEGTLGKQILSQPEEIQSMNGQRLPLNLTVEYISFSAHVDYKENSEFIDNVGSSNLVLVHGDSNEMGRLKSALMSKYAEKEQQMNIYSPRNCETVELYFRGEKTAKVIGQLAINNPEKGQIIKGILTQKDFTFQIVSNEEFVEFTELVTVPVILKQNLITRATFGLLKWHLEQMYGEVEKLDNGLRVFNAINVYTNHLESESKSGEFEVRLEWESNPINDMIADSVLALILQADTSPASVKATKGEHTHDHSHQHNEEENGDMVLVKEEKTEIGSYDFDIQLKSKKQSNLEEMMTKFLSMQFGKSRVVNLTPLTENISGLCWNINVDETEAVLNIGDNLEWVVECLDEDLKRRISVLASRIIKVSQPLAKTWCLA